MTTAATDTPAERAAGAVPEPSDSGAQVGRRGIPYKWELLALLWAAYFFNRADRQIFSFVMPQVKADLHLSDFQLGLVTTIFTWVYGLLVPFGGYLGDRLPRKWVITISLLLWSAATLCTGFAGGLVGLIVLRSLATGGGESFYYPAATSLIGQFHHRTRALAMSIHQTALYVGVVVSGLIVGYVAQTYGWREAFYVFGGAGVVLGLVTLWRMKDTPHGGAAEKTSTTVDRRADSDVLDYQSPKPIDDRLPASQVVRELTRKPTLLFLCLSFAGVAFVDIGYVTWMPTFLQEKYAMSPASAGFSSMFYHHLGAFIGILIAGRVTDLWSRTRRAVRIEAQVLGCLCGAPFIWMMGMSDTTTMCYVGLGVFGIFRGVWESNLYATLFEVVAPRLRSSAVGVMICSAFLIGALAPLLLGASKQKLGLSVGLASLSGVYVFAGLMLLSARVWTFRRDLVPSDVHA